MKNVIYYYIGIIIVGVISTVVIFSSMSADTWKDHRTEFTGVAPPDEINEKMDCLSRGGEWDYTSCEFESECGEGFKLIDGVCKELGKIREKDIPIFFEIQLMELDIKWELADRSWANPDFEIEPPARVCSHIIKENGVELYISAIWENEYSLSDMFIQTDMPDDCVKFLPVTNIGKDENKFRQD